MGRDDATAAERLFALGCTLLEDTQYALAYHAFDLADRRPPADLLIAYVLRLLATQHPDAALEIYARIADNVDPATQVVIADALVECGYVRSAVDAYRRGGHALKGEKLTRICARLLLDQEYGHLASLLREADATSIAPGRLVAWGKELLGQGNLKVAELAYEKAGAPLGAEEYLFYGQRMLERGNLDRAKALFLAARERASRA